MREIKFRAFHIELGRYLDGYDWDHYGPRTLNFGALSSEYHVIEQFTGLKDKNGVEIYEGDIISYSLAPDGTLISQILWHDGCSCFGVLDSGEIAVYSINRKDMAKRSTIIGNIHQDPELMETDQS